MLMKAFITDYTVIHQRMGILLQFKAQKLPKGLAYVSYNCLTFIMHFSSKRGLQVLKP